MKKITQTELNEILELHKIWMNSNCTAGVKADLEDVDLSGMNLNHADLRTANLGGAILERTDFSYANLTCADLICADLSHANLSGANLICAHLGHANLRYANLSYADLSRANLSYANLICANLKNANINDVLFPMGYNCFYVNFDDEQVLQFLFQALTIIQNSCKVSEKLKRTLLTEPIVNIANTFNGIAECAYGPLTAYKKEN